jgi:5'-3' exonuclease
MLLNCIIDGNYILSRLTFTLHKNNLLYGALLQSLENTISNYKKMYPFANFYLVSDSKEKSWRKKLNSNYKANRKKDSDIDWNFVYTTYEEFKQKIKTTGVIILESPTIEGDDWISFVIHNTNDDGQSNFIVSNDHDIKQLLGFDLEREWINFMSNEMYNQEKIFLPKNYQVFINKISSKQNDDIFNLNDNGEFLRLMNRFITKYQLVEINNLQSLFVKIISGDISDNIQSVYQTTKSGKIRGIGVKGASSIYETYIIEFGEPSLEDPDLFENIADVICEKKKISRSNIQNIVGKIKDNMKLIDLRIDNFPDEIRNNMSTLFNNR